VLYEGWLGGMLLRKSGLSLGTKNSFKYRFPVIPLEGKVRAR
jgi:hypothetical protein